MSVTLYEANSAIGSMDSAYFGIILKGFYIPKRTSAVITADYLLKFMMDKVFRIKQSEVKIGQLLDKASSQNYGPPFKEYRQANHEDLTNFIFEIKLDDYYLKMISWSYNHLTHPLEDQSKEDFLRDLKSRLILTRNRLKQEKNNKSRIKQLKRKNRFH